MFSTRSHLKCSYRARGRTSCTLLLLGAGLLIAIARPTEWTTRTQLSQLQAQRGLRAQLLAAHSPMTTSEFGPHSVHLSVSNVAAGACMMDTFALVADLMIVVVGPEGAG